MKLTIESIQEVEDPYVAFVDSIKNSETLRKYDKRLYNFLQLIPNDVYKENLGEIPPDDSKEILSRFFVRLAEKYPKLGKNIIAAYIKEVRKKVDCGEISPNTFSNYIKPIRRLDANSIAIHWKSLQRLSSK